MDQRLERHNVPKLTKGKTDNPNRPMSIKENEPIINILPRPKAPPRWASW